MARWQVMAGCAACLLVLGTGTVAKAEQTIDEAGVIVYRGGPGPFGFKSDEFEEAIAAHLRLE